MRNHMISWVSIKLIQIDLLDKKNYGTLQPRRQAVPAHLRHRDRDDADAVGQQLAQPDLLALLPEDARLQVRLQLDLAAKASGAGSSGVRCPKFTIDNG